MVVYRLTPRARLGLRSILEYVEGRFGARVAERVLDKIEAAFKLVAESPGVGHVREEFTSNSQVRFWAVAPSLIAYRVVEDVVEVLFVERGDCEWERLLEDEF